MTQCVISPPRRESAAGWLRPLTVATVTTLRKDLLPDFRRERRSMQPCNSRSCPRNSDKISLSRAQNTSLRHFTVLQLFDMDFDGTRIPRRSCAKLKNFKRRSTFAVCLSFLDFAVCLWRVLERRGEAEPLVYSSTRHSAQFTFCLFHALENQCYL